MPDYSNGKIYKLIGNGKIYVGSTTRRYLSQRLNGHRAHYNLWLINDKNYLTSFECLSDPNCYIELLEIFPCSCKDELNKKEGEWIKNLECVNKRVEGIPRNEQKKNWKIRNCDKVKQSGKEYFQKNKDIINEKRRIKRMTMKARIC